MIPEALGIGVAAYLAALLGARVRGRLEDSAYPSPEQADAELDALLLLETPPPFHLPRSFPSFDLRKNMELIQKYKF